MYTHAHAQVLHRLYRGVAEHVTNMSSAEVSSAEVSSAEVVVDGWMH